VPLRLKALLAIGAGFLVLSVGLFLGTRFVVLDAFARLEREEMLRTLGRVRAAIDDDLRALEGVTREWAASDDTYAFAQDRNAAGRRALEVDTTLVEHRLDVMAATDREGAILFARVFDHRAHRPATPARALLDWIRASATLLTEWGTRGRTGLLAVPGGVLEVSVQAIVTSRGEGPPRGTLVFGRFVDAAAVDRLSRATLSALTVHHPADDTLPEAFRADAAAREPTRDERALVQAVDGDRLAGFARLRDLQGRAVLVLRAESPREIHRSARAIMRYHTLALLAASVVLGGLIMLVLQRAVLSPLESLGTTVQRIASSGDTTARIPISGSKEFAWLGETINRMLRRIELTQSQRERERSLRFEFETRLRLAERSGAIEQLAQGLASDFSNLLTVIRGRVAYLRAHTDPDDPRRRHVEVLERTTDRAMSLAEQLLAFGRPDELAAPDVDVSALIMDMQPTLREVVGRDITIVNTLERSPARVRVSRRHLGQLIMNLVTNARDAMPGGGYLTLQTETVAIDDAFLFKHPGARLGRHLMLSVSDTGLGMDPETLDRMFDAFFTTKDLGQGTGLGLAIVFGIVKQHDGYITAESQRALGTRIRVYLPAPEAVS
jgi:signal transduction histidine kinase